MARCETIDKYNSYPHRSWMAEAVGNKLAFQSGRKVISLASMDASVLSNWRNPVDIGNS